MHLRNLLRLSLLALALLGTSCMQLKQFQESLTSVSRIKFKLDNVSNFELMGVNLSNKSKVGDFSLIEGAKLASAFARGKFPASFTLNIAAINPNDGREGRYKSVATMTSFAWTMIIDNTTTINGNITDPITIPASGEQSIIPLRMDLDLGQFFKDKGYESVANLALALGGVNGSPARIQLLATPRIKTDFGEINYPGQITIVDKEWAGQ
jgi:hypothetical protein